MEINIPGVMNGYEDKIRGVASYGKQQQQTPNLMEQFNSLLQQRSGIQNDKMTLQEGQLQKINTQKNNASFSNAFKNRDTLVSLMQQLLDVSRRSTANAQRVFK